MAHDGWSGGISLTGTLALLHRFERATIPRHVPHLPEPLGARPTPTPVHDTHHRPSRSVMPIDRSAAPVHNSQSEMGRDGCQTRAEQPAAFKLARVPSSGTMGSPVGGTSSARPTAHHRTERFLSSPVTSGFP